MVKHIKNITKILLMYILVLVAMVLGLFIIPIAMLSTEEFTPLNKQLKTARRFKWKWVDYIWGNKNDGIDGDNNYRYSDCNGKRNWWTTYNWSALRNLVDNLAYHLGASGTVVKYEYWGTKDVSDRVGQEGFKYAEITMDNGKTYPFYYWCKIWLPKNRGIKFDMGYKDFNIHKVPSKCDCSFVLAVNPFKTFKDKL